MSITLKKWKLLILYMTLCPSLLSTTLQHLRSFFNKWSYPAVDSLNEANLGIDVCVVILLKWEVGPAGKREMCPDVYVSICALLVLPTPLLLKHPLLLERKTSFSFLFHVQVPNTVLHGEQVLSKVCFTDLALPWFLSKSIFKGWA